MVLLLKLSHLKIGTCWFFCEEMLSKIFGRISYLQI